MLGDITPPRSFLVPDANPPGAGGSTGGFSPSGFGGSAMMSAGDTDSAAFGGMVGGAGGADGEAGHGRGEPRVAPGMLSVVLGLPLRLLGKVRYAVVRLHTRRSC